MTQRQKLWGALALVVCLHGLIFLAGFVAPYDFAAQNREQPFAAPTRLHFFDAGGRLHLRPFVRESDDLSTSSMQTEHAYELHFFVRGVPYKIAGLFVSNRHLFGVDEPGKIFLLGTDAYGRDQFSRFLYGGQISLLAGLLAAAVSVFLGMVIGAIAGFYGGWIDEILMRGSGTIPRFTVALLVVCRPSCASVAHSRVASVLASGRHFGADRVDSPSASDSRRRAECEGTEFRPRISRIRRFRPAYFALPCPPPDLRNRADPDGGADPAVRSCGGYADLFGTGRWRADAKLGKPSFLSPAVLCSCFILVDVPSRPALDPCLSGLLSLSRCATGTPQVRAAVKTSKSLLRIQICGEFLGGVV